MNLWPLAVAALVEELPQLDGWSDVDVSDGPPIGGSYPWRWCAVGYSDSDDDAGSFTDETSRLGNDLTAESGEVRGQLTVNSGDTDMASLRAVAFDLMATFRTWLRANPTLGVLPAGTETSMAVQVITPQNSEGAAVAFIWTISYSSPVY